MPHRAGPCTQLPGTLSLHALVWHDLVRQMGGKPIDNRATRYTGFGDDAAFNAGVRRLSADAHAQRRLRAELPLTGALTRPLVIQYNHEDPTINPRFETIYTQLAKTAAKVLPQTLPPTGKGHCGFTGDDVVRALKVLPE